MLLLPSAVPVSHACMQDRSGALATGRKGSFSAGEEQFMRNVLLHNISHLDTRLHVLKGCALLSNGAAEGLGQSTKAGRGLEGSTLRSTALHLEPFGKGRPGKTKTAHLQLSSCPAPTCLPSSPTVHLLPCSWFSDTLPDAPIKEIAFLRLDGDLYASTMDALTALYDRVRWKARWGHAVGWVVTLPARPPSPACPGCLPMRLFPLYCRSFPLYCRPPAPSPAILLPSLVGLAWRDYLCG